MQRVKFVQSLMLIQCGKLAVAKSPWRVKRPIRRLVFSSQSPNGRSLLPRRLTARDRERAREKGAGAGGVVPLHCAYAYGSPRIMCRDELGAFSFSRSAISVTASTSLPAGEVVSRANVFCARPQCPIHL